MQALSLYFHYIAFKKTPQGASGEKMEKITFFGTHSYDRNTFAEINKNYGFELVNHPCLGPLRAENRLSKRFSSDFGFYLMGVHFQSIPCTFSRYLR